MPYSFYYGFDYTYLLVIIGVIISMIASSKVNSTFNKYARVMSRTGMTGAMTAQRILNSAGIYDVQIQHVSGNLTDHYDPKNKVLRLSDSVYGSTSVAAVGVAAHECGHAIQHAKGYAPLSLRSALVPVANIGAQISWPLVLIGVLMGGSSLLINLGILLFCGALLFQVVTLPVEFNASRRAMQMLTETGVLYEDEAVHTRKVLNAAAMTYVAAVLASVLQLLRLLLLTRGRRNRD